jgi:hypothetical protein
MKCLFLLLFSTLLMQVRSQPILDLTDNLPMSDFYMIAQHHNSAANRIIDESLFFQLHEKYGVRFNIIEYSHSAAFLINRFLDTGDSIYLKRINETAPFSFIKKIKEWNDSKKADSQVRFYGIDFEGRNKGGITKAAIAEIFRLSGLSPSDNTYPLFLAVINAEERKMPRALSNLYNGMAAIGEGEKLKLALCYTDLMLMLKANYGFSPQRDMGMFNNFIYLYKRLSETERPKFYASFGIGHVNPDNRKSLSALLKESEKSPVKGQVTLIGVQYVNSYFGDKAESRTTGHLSSVCKSNYASSLATSGSEFSIKYLPAKELPDSNCKRDLALYAGVLIVQNSPPSLFWLWE